jgi:hypothetical protein
MAIILNNATDTITATTFSGNATSVSDGVTLSTNQTITGIKHFTDRLNVTSTGRTRLVLDSSTAQIKSLQWRTADLERWALRVSDAESGANAGADWSLRRYDDAGAYIDSPITVTRSTGAISFGSTINNVTLTPPATAATLTLANNSSLVTSGAFSTTLTSTAATNVTLPTTGTLATLAGAETLTNKVMGNYSESTAAPTISGNALTLDLATTNIFNVALNADVTTLTFSNVAGSGATSLTLVLTADGTPRTITWPGSVKWPGGTGPTLTSTNGKRDVLTFVTLDGGTTWLASVGGQDY